MPLLQSHKRTAELSKEVARVAQRPPEIRCIQPLKLMSQISEPIPESLWERLIEEP